MTKIINHKRTDCQAGDLFLSGKGLQCGNCLAIEEEETYQDSETEQSFTLPKNKETDRLIKAIK